MVTNMESIAIYDPFCKVESLHTIFSYYSCVFVASQSFGLESEFKAILLAKTSFCQK